MIATPLGSRTLPEAYNLAAYTSSPPRTSFQTIMKFVPSNAIWGGARTMPIPEETTIPPGSSTWPSGVTRVTLIASVAPASTAQTTTCSIAPKAMSEATVFSVVTVIGV